MIIVDTSAWIEYLNQGDAMVSAKVDYALDNERVAIGDLIYCEIMQGLRSVARCEEVSDFLLSLPQYEMVGFQIAQKSAFNYRLLRAKGVTIRKTIDVILGTFCAENDFQLIHNDRDFDQMAKHIQLDII